MEMDLLDDMYGEFNQDNHNSSVICNEDSVDIYSGLDNSPRSIPNAEKACTHITPQKLKESMDLYEEIITEEQHGRESSYNEMKVRFNSAQSQIEDLRKRLQQMETQNKTLNTENSCLKKNICALMKTAKMEIVRKDEEINRLSQRSGRFPAHHQSQMNSLKDQVSTRPNSSGHCGPCPPTQLQGLRGDCALKEIPQLQRKEDVVRHPDTSCVATTAPRPPPHVSTKCSRRDSEAPMKQKDSVVDSSDTYSGNRHPMHALGHGQSDKPKQTKHREGTGENPRPSESKGRQHKKSTDVDKECPTNERNRSHRAQKETGKYDSKTSKSRYHPADVVEHRRSEGAKTPPSDVVHSTASSAHVSKGLSKDSLEMQSKGFSRDLRHDKDVDGHCRSTKDSSSKYRKQAYSNQSSSSERSSESLNRKGRSSPLRDHRRKEERRREDDIRKRGERRKSSKELEGKRSKEHDQRKMVVSSKVVEKKEFEESKIHPTKPNVVEKSTMEENSPHRKLSFMETLNLTLSPVKKPKQSAEAKEQDDTTPEEVLEGKSGEDSGQLDVEELCVIDEINSSASVVDSDEILEDPVVQSSSEIPIPLGPISIEGKCIDEEPCKDYDKAQTEALVTNEQPKCQSELEEKTIQDSLECRNKLSRATEDKKRTEVSAPDSDVTLKTAPQSKNCASEGKTGQSEDPTASTLTPGNCGNNSNNDTCHSNSFYNRPTPESPAVSLSFTDKCVLDSALNSETPSAVVCKSLPVETVTQDPIDVACVESPAINGVDGRANPEGKDFQEQPSVSVTSNSSQEKDVSKNAVSSSISMEVLTQSDHIAKVVSDVTQIEEDFERTVVEKSSSLGSFGVSKVSSTTGEVSPSEQHNSGLPKSTNKSCNTDTSCTEHEEENVEPSSSIPLVLDEDSMMLTLNSLKTIPDAISPLTSPIRLTKKSQPHCHNKPPHVKSLCKEFSSAAVDASSKKLDVNKENKHPVCSMKRASQRNMDQPSEPFSRPSEDELEEGEIITESEGEETPSPSLKTVKRIKTVKNQPSPKSSPRLSKRLSIEKKGNPELRSKTAAASTGSPLSHKSRFKTVLPPSSKTSLSTMEEVMDMFKDIRFEVRKKYMKLHLKFPMKTFSGIIDNALESFTGFVDSISLNKLCNEGDNLKANLKNIIVSVLSKISNNGIVNRIFDQQSQCLKQKLWDFVDVQLDFLFKEIHTALADVCKQSKGSRSTRAEEKDKKFSVNKMAPKSPVAKTSGQKRQREEVKLTESVEANMKRIRSPNVFPCKTGLGSRGKNIKMSIEEEDKASEPHTSHCHPVQPVVEILPPKSIPSTTDKAVTYVRRLSQNGSIQDRSDYEILTEQQASSLTFNLVTDSQMGEIFKCLLQGSDLLDTNVSAVDNHGWPIGTPRKEAPTGERLMGITTPNKVGTPSKLIATWSSISPRKLSSPSSKAHIPLNPAVLDESCLLEVPSGLPQSAIPPQFNVFSQRSYSILAEDLAVSLTMPSPLKSDSHLSFLHPASGQPMSVPENIISAHFSEDALMDGEDATEQDIHLSLDTDNSSCGSSEGRTREGAVPPLFHFKPHLPMQAVVMEKSNDHFIVRIRQASTSPGSDARTDETIIERPSAPLEHGSKDREIAPEKSPSKAMFSECSHPSLSASTETVNCKPLPQEPVEPSADETAELAVSGANLMIMEEATTPKKDRRDETCKKRKKHHMGPKAKQAKKELIQERSKPKKGSKSSKGKGTRSSKRERSQVTATALQLSPNSLSAKNVIKKKGEVVVTWTRDEDRAILLDLKMKGASSDTFSSLSERLHKSPAQIAERFNQLMKLFKKKEKMES